MKATPERYGTKDHSLEPRNWRIVRLITDNRMSLAEIGELYGITHQRVQQIGAAVGIRRGVTPRKNWEHGTISGYTNNKCRCSLCTDALRVYQARYMATHPEQREKNRQRMRTLRAGRASR